MRFGLLAAALAAALFACSPQSGDNKTIEEKDAAMTGPFADYTPWDSNRENVLTTESGLEYIIIESGDASGASPTPHDQVTVHYDGRLADGGKKFDSSFDRGEPATFVAGGLIPGWIEALQIMKPGDEWLLFIPSRMGYGEHGAGADIPPNADLIFHMQLLDVAKAASADEEAWSKYTPWPSGDDVQKTASGLEYIVLDSGDPASATAEDGDFVLVHAEGRLTDGQSVIISSYREGAPQRLPAGEPVLGEGWMEAMQMMRAGDRWMVKVPYSLAFGEDGAGPVPAKSDVVFEIDMQQIIDLG